jgi:hypothetical protein
MTVDDPTALDLVRRSMVARIATLSRNGRPSINPLYFLVVDDKLWLGTSDWTLAARNVGADPRVSVLFEDEHAPRGGVVVRIRGQARVRTDRQALRSYNLGVARRYVVTRGGIRNLLSHRRQLGLRRRYYAHSGEKGGPCVIEVAPEHIERLESGAGSTDR